jgi:endoglucanase
MSTGRDARPHAVNGINAGGSHTRDDEERAYSSDDDVDQSFFGERRDRDATRKSLRSWRVPLAVSTAVCFVAYYFRHMLYAALAGVYAVPPGLWSSREGVLTVGKNTPFHLKGISWYGMETENHCLEGLAMTSMTDILDTLVSQDINAIRVPLALDLWDRNPGLGAACISIFANAGEKATRPMTYKQLLSLLVKEAAERDILILLDLHRLAAKTWPTKGFWYSNSTSASDVVDFWKAVARTFKADWNILGCDVFNEPHGAATWADWRKFVEEVGNAVHEIAPAWLIFAEGVGSDAGGVKTSTFWGENLHPAYSDPPKLKLSRKLVLSPHVYGMPCFFINPYQFPDCLIHANLCVPLSLMSSS